MSIETEITRISTNVSDTLSAVSEMGGEVPEGATSNDMAAGVRSIPVGAKIDDTTPSSTTVYSSQKIESVVSALNQANAQQDEVIATKANNADLAKVAKSGSYNDLTGKPTIPTVPTTLPNPNALTFTGAVNETYDGSTAKSVAIPTVPTTLPNPNKLKLTGAVTAEYDGSEAVSVEIPAGGSNYTLPVANETTLGGVKAVTATDEMTDNVGIDENGMLKVKPGGSAKPKVTIEVLAEGTVTNERNFYNRWCTDTGLSLYEVMKVWRIITIGVNVKTARTVSIHSDIKSLHDAIAGSSGTCGNLTVTLECVGFADNGNMYLKRYLIQAGNSNFVPTFYMPDNGNASGVTLTTGWKMLTAAKDTGLYFRDDEITETQPVVDGIWMIKGLVKWE